MLTLEIIKPRSSAMAFFDPRAQVLPFMTAKLADLWTEVWKHAPAPRCTLTTPICRSKCAT